MPKDYVFPGMRAFLDSEADRLGLKDDEHNGHPVAIANRAQPLSSIASHIVQASDLEPDATDARSAVLANCGDYVAALVLSLSTGIKALEAAYLGLGLKVPPWVGLTLLVGDEAIVSPVKAKKGPGRPKKEPATLADPPVPAPDASVPTEGESETEPAKPGELDPILAMMTPDLAVEAKTDFP